MIIVTMSHGPIVFSLVGHNLPGTLNSAKQSTDGKLVKLAATLGRCMDCLERIFVVVVATFDLIVCELSRPRF